MEIWAIILAIVLLVLIAIAILIYYIISKKKNEIEAVEVARPRGGMTEMMPFDEDLEEALYKRKVVCPDCGAEVDPYDEVCPSCGAKLKMGEFECSNCGAIVDPRDKECPYCGEILLPEPFVCPNCGTPVEADATRCDSCGARFWSPIRLDEKSLKKRIHKVTKEETENEEEKEVSSGRTIRR